MTVKFEQVEKLEKMEVESEEDKASVWSRMIVAYLDPLFLKGYQEPIQMEDLGRVSGQDRISVVFQNLDKFLKHEFSLPVKQQSLWRALWRTATWTQVNKSMFLYALYSASTFGPPW